MTILNPPVFDHIVETNGRSIMCKVLSMGTWNMNAQSQLSVAHGLNLDVSTIVHMGAVVRDDNSPHNQYDYIGHCKSSATSPLQSIQANANNIVLTTGTASDFATTAVWSGVAVNRGYIFIMFF